jgi:actin-related protein
MNTGKSDMKYMDKYNNNNSKSINYNNNDYIPYTLPDGQTIQINNSHLYECTERFFDPMRFADICDTDEDPLHTAIVKSVMATDMDLRRNLLNSVVLTGGNTLFHGLADRLTHELKHTLPGSMSSSLRVVAPADRNNAVWIGGSILTSLSTFGDQWISCEDYDEYGSGIVHEKCSVYL